MSAFVMLKKSSFGLGHSPPKTLYPAIGPNGTGCLKKSVGFCRVATPGFIVV